MTTPNFFMLYVEAPEASARFYADLFAVAPVEVSPTFALFILEAGFKFGLWARHGVEPALRDPVVQAKWYSCWPTPVPSMPPSRAGAAKA